MGLAVVRAQALALAPVPDAGAQLVDRGRREHVLLDVDDLAPVARAGGSRARAARPAPRRTSTRACCGSATARRRGRSARPARCSKPPIRSSASTTWRCFSSSWRSYGRTCHGAPGCGRARLDPVGRRLEQLRHARLAVAPLALEDARADAVARDRALHEQDVAARAGDAARRRGRATRPRARARRRPTGGCVSRPVSCDLCWQAVNVDEYRSRGRGVPDRARPRVLRALRGPARTTSRSRRSTSATRAFSAARRSTALRGGDSRELLKFAAEGYVEQAVKELAAELARLEASLEVEVDGETHSVPPGGRRAGERARSGAAARARGRPQRAGRDAPQPAAARDVRPLARARRASSAGRACAR